MGKIANALGKYAHERKAARIPNLTKVDLEVLLNYNRETGHLLNYDSKTGQVGNHSMEVLRNRGVIQRLMDNKLIFPGGKLTPRGLQECERLQRLRSERSPVMPDEDETSGRPIESKEAAISVETPEILVSKTPKLEIPETLPTDRPDFQAQPSSAVEAKPRLSGKSPVDMEPVARPIKLEKPIAAPPPIPDGKIKTVVKPIADSVALKEPAPQEKPASVGEDKAAAKDDRPEEKKTDPISKKPDSQRESTKAMAVLPGVGIDENTIDPNLITLMDPQSYEAEQFKILRANLLFPVTGAVPKSILVTGALPGDGKSFVSANLAVSIAMNINKHVLLIDCDLRKPDIHGMFGFRETPGLTEYLMGHNDLESLLLKTVVDKLTLLPGGSVPPNPAEIMSSERMTELLQEVRDRYNDRLIVVDSPPPALAAESAFLARYVDGIIVVVKQGKTPRREVEDLMSAVGSEKILGCVINQLDFRVSSYYGRKKYSKYGKRYYK